MNVLELFRQLSYGELSNLSIGSEGVGSINEEKRANLISYTNEALLRLYSRFVLRENDLILKLHDHITNYHFLKKFAQTNTEPCEGMTLYIIDQPHDPFEEDLIKVLRVVDADTQADLVLNDEGNPHSLFTPQPNTLQVPTPVTDQVLGIVYQARHPIIAYDDFEACIELPVVLHGPLKAFIAHMVFKFMNGQENSAKATEYLAIYDALCNEVVERDLVNSSSSTTTYKFEDRGFA